LRYQRVEPRLVGRLRSRRLSRRRGRHRRALFVPGQHRRRHARALARRVDHDSILDLAAYGNSIRLHEGGSLLDDTAYLSIDCDPPVVLPNSTCDESLANFVGTLVPSSSGDVIYAGNTEAHSFW